MTGAAPGRGVGVVGAAAQVEALVAGPAAVLVERHGARAYDLVTSGELAEHLRAHADDGVCRLVTTGRRTGRRHDIEIWFGVVGADQLGFISGNGPTADWYRNALADPAVEVRLGNRWFAGTARDATGDDRRRVGAVLGAKHRGWGGDPDIDLTEDAWTWSVPALLVYALRPIGSMPRSS